jgi:MoaA/NifB/PqqE/SkfB family radical SAM enzyme
MPVLCNYYVTYRCNAKCSFCDIWEQPSPLVELEHVENNLDDLKRLGVRFIDFTGGEPLLHPRLDEMLTLAKGRGLITTCTTNTLLYPKRARQLAGKIDLLHFSIDSSVAAEHDASRGVRCFSHLMESIKIALSVGERPDLLFTITNDNYHRLDEIYKTISRPNGLVLIINPLFEYNGLGESLTKEAIKAARQIAREPLTYLNPAFLSLRSAGGNNPQNPVCKAASAVVVISPFNELVLPCYHAGIDRVKLDNDLFRAWHSDLAVWHRKMEGRHAACDGCSINCYFEPSFAVQPGTRYFWQSIPSKASYAWTKFVLQRVESKFGKTRRADLPAQRQDEGAAGSDVAGADSEYVLPVLNESRNHAHIR